ncbi:MAG: VanZ family protein [Defluviitaleaceae bacterium]|nr:VanZ family protein [Defluviitaleaceae bacterium]MCL2263469.1 VanZ family protein [Defluviitaleaceae bacterium]
MNNEASKIRKIIWPVLSVLVALGIFISSAMTGEVSGYASMTIAGWVRYILPVSDSTLAVMHFFVRKTAHFVVYFVLAFCVAHSFKFYVHSFRKLLLLAWGIASVYGVTDEIHQYFVPGRVMAISDMLINAAGAFVGAAVVVWYLRRT